MTTAIEACPAGAKLRDRGSEAFSGFETAYLDLAIDFLHERFVLEDLTELALWEDFGLIRKTEVFLSTLPERHADTAVRHLARLIAELRREELEYQLHKATRLRRAVLAGQSTGRRT